MLRQVLPLLLVIIFASPNFCFGQQQPQQQTRRRRFVEGLMNAFVESQVQSDRVAVPQSATVQAPTGTRADPSTPRPQPNRSATAASPELRQAAELLSQASNEMVELVRAMDGDLVRAPSVRQLMTLAFKVRSDAATLSRRLAHATDAAALSEPLRQLDQDWHTLEYRLGQIPNLSRSTTSHLEQVRRLETQLTSMFEVPTQVDLSGVSDQAARMNNSLRTLLDDIRYEVTDTNSADRLLQEGRGTYDSLQKFIATTRSARTDYNQLTSDFKTLEKEWFEFEHHLRPLNNRFIQRQTQQISDAGHRIHQLLYLQVEEVSREDLAHSVVLVQQGTEQLLDLVSLRMLTELPAARRFAIDSAADFYTTGKKTLEVIKAGDNLEVAKEMYIHMHDEWERLSMALDGVQSQRTRQAVSDVNVSLDQLQHQLGVQFAFDRRQAIGMAANLFENARHLQGDVREVFRQPNRYSPEFRSGSLQAAADFQGAARDLGTRLSNGDKLQQLKASAEKLTSTWEALNQAIPQFNPSERSNLQRAWRAMTPQVVQMQTLFAL